MQTPLQGYQAEGLETKWGQTGGTGSQVTVQPYSIKLPDNKVDLFDPDA
jgi:hypothetical protein